MMYPPTATRRRTPLQSAMSEPDDLRRRNRDLFLSRPLGLSHPGPLLELALATREAVKGSHVTSNNTTTTTSSITSSSTLSSSPSSASDTGGLFSSPPRLRSPSTTKSLFSDTPDWPFPLCSSKKESWSFKSVTPTNNNNTSNNSSRSTPSTTNNTNKKEDLLPWAIQEESAESTLELAQARLRQDDKIISPPIKWTPPPSALQFLSSPPPTAVGEDNNTDDESDSSSSKPLTGLARRRKRSSAARALKDKLAAEAVDFDLMEGKIIHIYKKNL